MVVTTVATRDLTHCHFNHKAKRKTKLRGLQSASELYRPSDRRLSAKLLPTFADRGCRVVSATEPPGRSFGFLDRSSYFCTQVAPQLSSRG
jgi:hypothetical protein